MWWRPVAALLLAVLLCNAVHAELIITPSDINTCSNSSTDTSLQVSRVQTCASASVVGYGTGSAFSFSVSKANIMRAAASACGDAVGNSIGELCAGADPMATIFNMATTCSTALAALYTKAVTANGAFDMSVKGMNGTVTKEGKLVACGTSCSNAQGAAQAFAQAAACGIGKATDNCMAATSYIKTHAFTRAFVKSASDSWGKACTQTIGFAHSGGETIAVSAAASIAQAMTAVAASACGSCPTCKCKKLPAMLSWGNLAGNFSEAASTVAAGRVGLAHAMADATTNFCNSNGTMESAKSHARTIMGSYADLVMGALGAVKGHANVIGTNSWACGSSTLTGDLLTIKDASAEVFADAAGTVFNSWCPKAAAKINQLKLLTNETLNHLINKSAERCTQKNGNGQASDFVTLLTTGNKPFVQNIADALTEAKSCGCKKVACLWCASGKNVLRQAPGATGLELPSTTAAAPAVVTPPPAAALSPAPAAAAAAAAPTAPTAAAAHTRRAFTGPQLLPTALSTKPAAAVAPPPPAPPPAPTAEAPTAAAAHTRRAFIGPQMPPTASST